MKLFFTLGLSLLFSQHLFAQNEKIDLRTDKRIKLLAERRITYGLQDLLNEIANKENDDADIKNIIQESHSGSRLKIFAKPDIIVEDDINPNNNSFVNVSDSKLQKYLDDFDLYYTKSDDKSVNFSEVRVSNIKKSNDGKNQLYVNVYYISYLRNKSKAYTDKEYMPTSRVANIRVEKNPSDNQWTGYIQGISFVNQEDTLNDYVSDILIDDTEVRSQTTTDTTTSNFAIQASLIQEIEADELKKAENAEKEANKYFSDIIEKGDKAMEKNDFVTAKAYYMEAKGLRPSDRNVKKRLTNLINQERLSQLSDELIYKDYLKKSGVEEKKRNFRQSKAWLVKALALNIKDANTPSYEAKIKTLDAKWQVVAELSERFDAGIECKILIEEYTTAIKKSKENSDLYLGRGKCYDKMNNLPKALKDYDLAFQYDNMNLPALKARAELKIKMNDLFKALNDYENYLTIYDEDLSIYESLSDLRLSINKNKYDEAIKVLDDGLEKNSEWAPFYYKKGLLLAQKKDHREALKAFTLGVKYKDNDPLLYFQRGKSYLETNDVKNAALDFESARKYYLDTFNLRTTETLAKSYYQRSVNNFNVSNLDSAMNQINDAIAIYPLNSDFHFKKGEYYITTNRNEEALKSLTQAINLNKRFTEAYYKRGVAYYNLKKYNEANNSQKETLGLNAKYYGAQRYLGDGYFALKDYVNAAQQFEAYLSTTSNAKVLEPAILPVVYNTLGKSYFSISESDEKALTAYKNAIKKDANYAEAYYNRGLYYYKKSDLTNAVADMVTATTIDKKQSGWTYQLANVYNEKGEPQNAKIYFIVTMSIDSLKSYPNALYLKGKAEYVLQDYTSALQSYSQVMANKKDSQIPGFTYEYGDIHLKLNQIDSALFYLQQASVKDPNNANISYALGTSHLLKGNIEDAFTLLEKAFQSKQFKEKAVKNDKQLASIKDDKRFKALMKKYF